LFGHLPFGVYLDGLGAAAALMTGAWLLSLSRADASVVDGFWGIAIAGLGWFYAARLGDVGAPGLVALALATAWGLRLSGYLAWRNWGEPEDFRYRQMRERHGARFPAVSLITVFLLQAVLAWLVSAPLFQAVGSSGDLGAVGWIGASVAAAGLLWEATADWQLQRFLAAREDPEAVCREGLWRYSRHPNYFGEFVFWWGIFLVVLPTDGVLWSAVGPVLMTVLLLRISGVPMLEERLAERPAYRPYVEETNAFFPGPPGGTA
jgi:steroid 5-alpha reductase family enzyme